MAEHKVLYRNSGGVRRTSVYNDDKPDELSVYTEADMESVLESIKEAQEIEAGRNFPINRHLAAVPMTVYETSIVEQWDEDRWKKWLNDPDNAAFRVWPGRV